jgi:hypothetical protein
VRIEQVDDGKVDFVAVPADDRAAVELLARADNPRPDRTLGDVPTMYHAIGNQRGTARNNGDLQARSEQGKIAVYQGKRLDLAAF